MGLLVLACISSASAARTQNLLPDLEATQPFRDSQPLQLTDSRDPEAAAQRLPPPIPDRAQVRRNTLGIIGGSALAIGLYGNAKWWKDGFTGDFNTVNEGWFGQHTYAGGADKLGHFYMNYAGTRLISRAFQWVGNDPEQSLALAAWTTLGTYTAVEVLDGFSRKWRFSKEDAIMNTLGVGAALLLEKNPELDRVLDLRLLYRPSRQNNYDYQPFDDYAGQTYLLVAKASGIPLLREQPVLRYLEFAVGYGTRGYKDKSGVPAQEGTRHVYAGISLNLSELLNRTVFADTSRAEGARDFSNTFLEFVQIPGTAVLKGHTLSTD
jgi:hypothetical protein